MAMLVMSDLEAFKLMKETDPFVKVILSSGFKQDEGVNEALEMGVFSFLQKSYTLDTLIEILNKI